MTQTASADEPSLELVSDGLEGPAPTACAGRRTSKAPARPRQTRGHLSTVQPLMSGRSGAMIKGIGQGGISSVCVVALAALALGAVACGGGAPASDVTRPPVLRVSMIPTTDPG